MVSSNNWICSLPVKFAIDKSQSGKTFIVAKGDEKASPLKKHLSFLKSKFLKGLYKAVFIAAKLANKFRRSVYNRNFNF
jgi:hypothetical protein